MGHNYVGTEMLLVGVVADTSGASGKVLKKFNVTLKDRRVDYPRDLDLRKFLDLCFFKRYLLKEIEKSIEKQCH